MSDSLSASHKAFAALLNWGDDFGQCLSLTMFIFTHFTKRYYGVTFLITGVNVMSIDLTEPKFHDENQAREWFEECRWPNGVRGPVMVGLSATLHAWL